MPAIVPKPQNLASRSQVVILKRHRCIKHMPNAVAVKMRPCNSMIDRFTSCEVSGHPVTHHFVEVNKMVDLGLGSQREIDDMTSILHDGRRETSLRFRPGVT